MKKMTLAAAVAMSSLLLVLPATAEELSQFISAGKATADLRLRYEQNDTRPILLCALPQCMAALTAVIKTSTGTKK